MEFKYLNTMTMQKHFTPEELRESYSHIIGGASKNKGPRVKDSAVLG